MPLTQLAQKKIFGNANLQEIRDWSGPNGALLYEGYASPAIGTATAGWTIIKHFFDGSNSDTSSYPKSGLIWDIRNIYDYSKP